MSTIREAGWRQRAKIALATTLGGGLLRLLARTWRVTREHDAALAAIRASGAPFVIILWHGELLPILWAHRDEGVSVLISTHADGEIIARICESLGCRTVRGSSSRGGARALLELVRELDGGHEVAITPDGPRGPRRSFAPGAVVAAMRADVPIIAFGARVDRAWRLRSWDRFVIPKPFARITMRYSATERVAATAPRDAELEVPRFRELLMAVCGPDEG
ncbi:MAG: lysophospholipid acyltransferase family protein [Gemmatimonadaceae bacterium]|nr:lysophospholipid acyltransferase family protein [Gemmatimonadaceae bacterium]